MAVLVLTVLGRAGALRRVRAQVVARVRVLVHGGERVRPERGPRAGEGGLDVVRRALGLAEVVRVVLRVSQGAVLLLLLLLQLDEGGLARRRLRRLLRRRLGWLRTPAGGGAGPAGLRLLLRHGRWRARAAPGEGAAQIREIQRCAGLGARVRKCPLFRAGGWRRADVLPSVRSHCHATRSTAMSPHTIRRTVPYRRTLLNSIGASTENLIVLV